MAESSITKQETSSVVGFCRPPVQHQFKPGQSGNPAGRPKGQSVTAILRQVVDADDSTLAEQLVRKLVDRAIGGDIRAIREVLDRLEGKPRQSIAVSREETRSAEVRAGELLASMRRMVGVDEPGE